MPSLTSVLGSRRYHRWMATVAAVLLAIVALTGIAIQFEILIDDGSAPALGVAPEFPQDETGDIAYLSLTDDEIAALMATALQAAHRQAPGANIVSAQLRLVRPEPIAEIVVAADDNPMPRQLFFLARTGDIAAQPTLIRRIHFYLLGAHRGTLIGPAGTALGIATGIALLILAITGLAIYYHLWRARTQSGRPGVFWR